MNEINFLPETFRRNHRRQRRRPIEFLLIAATMAALAGLWLSTSGPDSALAVQAEQLDQSLEAIAQLQSEEQRLASERSDLQRKLMTARETYQPITATQIVSRLSRLTPEPIRLTSVEFQVDRPEPERMAKPQTTQTKVVGEVPTRQPAEPNLMRISIAGHAPSDEQLVTMIRRLDADPVFTSVALRGSRQDQTKTHFVRVFHLDVQIDLDRRFVEAKEGGRHAD